MEQQVIELVNLAANKPKFEVTHDIFIVGSKKSGRTALVLSKISGSHDQSLQSYYNRLRDEHDLPVNSSSKCESFYHFSKAKMKFRVRKRNQLINFEQENGFIIVVADLTNMEHSIDCLQKKYSFDDNVKQRVIVVGSKSDILTDENAIKQLETYCKSNRFSAPIITSAKQGIKIDEVFDKAIKYYQLEEKQIDQIINSPNEKLTKLQNFFNCASVKNLPAGYKKNEFKKLIASSKKLIQENNLLINENQQLLADIDRLIVATKAAASIHRTTGLSAIFNWFHNPTTLNDFDRMMGEEGDVAPQIALSFSR